jgi:hypothetical protein
MLPENGTFIMPSLRAVDFKDGKAAIRWTRLSCRSLAANALRLQLLQSWQLSAHAGDARADQRLVAESLKEKLIKIGAKVVNTAAISPSRWLGSPFRAICSPTSFGSPLNCGHRRSRQQRNEFDLSRVP